jgi:hypothetical protein
MNHAQHGWDAEFSAKRQRSLGPDIAKNQESIRPLLANNSRDGLIELRSAPPSDCAFDSRALLGQENFESQSQIKAVDAPDASRRNFRVMPSQQDSLEAGNEPGRNRAQGPCQGSLGVIVTGGDKTAE